MPKRLPTSVPVWPSYTYKDNIVLPNPDGNPLLTIIQDVTNAELQAAVDKLLMEVTNTFSSVSSDITAKRKFAPPLLILQYAY